MRVKPLKPGPVWRFLSSIYLAIGLILALAIVCVVGHGLGIKETEQVFFEAWWFSGLMIVLAINIVFGTLNRSLASPPGFFPWRLSQVPWLMVHLGLLTIIAGGILTRWRTEGQLYVAEGGTERTLLLEARQITVQRPPTTPDARWKESYPVKLTHLPQTPEGATLADRRDQVLWSGTIFWIGFTGLLAGLASVLVGREPARIVLSVLVPLGIVGQGFAIQRADLSIDAFGGDARIDFVRYYPHHRVEPLVEDDPTGAGPPALRFDLQTRVPFLETRPALVPLQVDFPNEALLESGSALELRDGLTVAAQRLHGPEEAERLLGGKPSLGALVLRLRGATTRVALDALVKQDGPDRGKIDAEVTVGGMVGGMKLHLARFFWHLQVHDDQAQDASPGGALVNPAVQVDRVTMPDGSVSTVQRDGKPAPRELFIFGNPDFRRLNKDAGFAGLELGYEQSVWRLPPGRSVSFVVVPDGSVRLLALGLDAAPPPKSLDDVLRLPVLAPGAAVPMPGLRGLEVVLRGLSPSVRQSSRTVPIDTKTTVDGEKMPDAVLVRVTKRDGASAERWLSFGGREGVELNVGGEPWTVSYTAQTDQLPFDVHLRKFDIEWAPGQEDARPLGFKSTVDVRAPAPRLPDGIELTPEQRRRLDEQERLRPSFSYDIYMNHTLVHEGYTLYQSSYIKGQGGQPDVSVFAVQSDPGQYVFYVGAALLALGVAGFFWAQPWLREVELRRRGQGAVKAEDRLPPLAEAGSVLPALAAPDPTPLADAGAPTPAGSS